MRISNKRGRKKKNKGGGGGGGGKETKYKVGEDDKTWIKRHVDSYICIFLSFSTIE